MKAIYTKGNVSYELASSEKEYNEFLERMNEWMRDLKERGYRGPLSLDDGVDISLEPELRNNDTYFAQYEGPTIKGKGCRFIGPDKTRYVIMPGTLQTNIAGFKEDNNMKKNTVKLNENTLRRIVAESVKKTLSEIDWKTYANAAEKRRNQPGMASRADALQRAADERFNEKFGFEKDLGDNGGEYSTERVSGNIAPGNKSVKLTRDRKNLGPTSSNMEYNSGSRGMGEKVPGVKWEPTQQGIDAYQNARRELDNYVNGKYAYNDEKGWHLKEAKVSESELNKIISESVKKALNEGIFGNKIVDPNAAYNELCSIAQKYGYNGVKYKNGRLLISATAGNGEPTVFGTRITLPQNVGSGMFGTGSQGWDMKSYQNLKQQLINYCEQVKMTNAKVADERAKEWKEEQEYKKRKPEQQKQIDRSEGLPGGVYRGEDGRLYDARGGLVSGGMGYNPYTQSYNN